MTFALSHIFQRDLGVDGQIGLSKRFPMAGYAGDTTITSARATSGHYSENRVHTPTRMGLYLSSSLSDKGNTLTSNSRRELHG
jgi:hypothetical protein